MTRSATDLRAPLLLDDSAARHASLHAIAEGLGPGEAEYPTVQDRHRAVLIGEATARSVREQRWLEIEPGGAR